MEALYLQNRCMILYFSLRTFNINSLPVLVLYMHPQQTVSNCRFSHHPPSFVSETKMLFSMKLHDVKSPVSLDEKPQDNQHKAQNACKRVTLIQRFLFAVIKFQVVNHALLNSSSLPTLMFFVCMEVSLFNRLFQGRNTILHCNKLNFILIYYCPRTFVNKGVRWPWGLLVHIKTQISGPTKCPLNKGCPLNWDPLLEVARFPQNSPTVSEDPRLTNNLQRYPKLCLITGAPRL